MKSLLYNRSTFRPRFHLFWPTIGVFLVLQLLAFSITHVAWASVFGGGHYGSGTYNVGEGLSPAGAPSCGETAPGSPAPWLYTATARSGSSIALSFTNASEPYDHYAVEYGTQSGSYIFGATDVGGKGTRTVVIQALNPNTTYYFRVRAGNGCATGAWSNEIAAKTLSLFSLRNLQTDMTDLSYYSDSTGSDADDPKQTSSQRYQIRLKIVDSQQRPVTDATVTLSSEPRQAKTGEDGTVVFNDVEPGEHSLVIDYRGYTKHQTIFLQGDDSTYDMTLQIETQDVTITSPSTPVIIISMAVVVIALVLLFARWRRGASDLRH